MRTINYLRQRRHFVESQARAAEQWAAAAVVLLSIDHYGELWVLRSAAGFYVGTLFWDSEFRYWSPGSRDSGYFSTRPQAQVCLDYWNRELAA